MLYRHFTALAACFILVVVMGLMGASRRTHASGEFDPLFGATQDAVLSNPSPNFDSPSALTADDTGVYIGGADRSPVNEQWRIEKRTRDTGALITTFGVGGVVTENPSVSSDRITGLAVDGSGLYVAGYDQSLGILQWRIEKRDPVTGALDSVFGGGTGIVTSSPGGLSALLNDMVLDGASLYLAGRDSAAGSIQWRIEKRDKFTGALDTTFGGGTGAVTSDPSGADDIAYAIIVFGADIYVAGTENGSVVWRIEKRSAATGLLDGVFGAGTGVISLDISAGFDVVEALAIDSSGLYVFGRVSPGDDRWYLEKRDLSSGDLDPGFGSGGVVQVNPSSGADRGASVASDGNAIYLLGREDEASPNWKWRYEKRDAATGAPDPGFNGTGALTIDPSSLDDVPTALYVDGGALYGTGADRSLGNDQWRIEKRDAATGAADPAFRSGPGYVQSYPNLTANEPNAMAVDGGSLFVGGSDFILSPLNQQWHIEKRDATTGALDTVFGSGTGRIFSNPSANDDVATEVVVFGSSVFIAGTDRTPGDAQWRVEKRDAATGALSTAFDGDGVVTANPSASSDSPRAVAADATGLYIAGRDGSPGNFEGRLEKRDLTTGALIPAFSFDGVITLNPSTAADGYEAVIVDATSLYLAATVNVAGDQQWRVEKRDKMTGVLDTTFGGGAGYVDSNPTAVTGDGPSALAQDASSIYVAGYQFTGNGAWRVEKRSKTTGALDLTFGGGTGFIVSDPSASGFEEPSELLIDASHIYIIGRLDVPPFQWRVERRDTTTGVLDTGFGAGGILHSNIGGGNESAWAGALDATGFYIAGADSAPSTGDQWRIEKRLIPAGVTGCGIEPATAPYENTTFVAIPEGPSANTADMAFQWNRNGAPIPGETYQRLPRQGGAGDTLTVDCAALNSQGVAGPTVTSPGLVVSAGTSPYGGAAAAGLWNMMSVPLADGDHLADDFLFTYRWNEVTQSYEGGTGASQPANVTGEGVWGYVAPWEQGAAGGRNVDATGAEVGASTFVVSGLTSTGGTYQGKHLLGVPFNFPVWFTDLEVSPASAGTYIPIGQAAVDGLIEYNMWMRYDNVAGQYLPWAGNAVDGKMFPWEGFWMHALTDIDVRFNVPGPPPPPLAREQAAGDHWTVTLSATAGVLRDDYNAFGVAPDAADGWDYHDATDGGTLNAAHVVLTFPHPELRADLSRLAHDIRPPETPVTWTAEVDAVNAGQVTLAWDNVPSGYVVTLTDTTTGATAIMNDTPSFTYWSLATEVRPFEITAEKLRPVSTDARKAPAASVSATAESSAAGCVAARDAGADAALGVISLLAGLVVLRRKTRVRPT